MKGRAVPWSEEELEWIEIVSTYPRRVIHAAFCEEFDRPDVSIDDIKSLCTRKGWATGRTGRFQPGTMPPNKGQKMPFNANSAKTQFKKGHAPANRKGIGHERFSKDGYVEISVAETNPHTGHGRRYVHKHRWLWEAKNGPVPKGMCLKALDGNKANTGPDNWEAIPRALLPRLNGRFGRNYDEAPAELKPIILATAKLEHAAREAKKRQPQ